MTAWKPQHAQGSKPLLVANGGTGGNDPASAREALGVNLTNIGVSSYAQTLLDDATAADALTTLGVSSYAQTILDDTTAGDALTTLGVSSFVQTLLDDVAASNFLTTLGVSAFIQMLLDDADAATARATLGFAEGSWTPVLNIGGTEDATYTTQVGRYIRTGNLVTVWASIVITNNGAGTGNATITGLPFAASTVAGLEYVGSITEGTGLTTGGNNLSCIVASGGSSILLFVDEQLTPLTQTTITDAADFSVSVTYRTG